MVFEKKGDADRVREVLPKRFGKYGLALHPEKTRRVAFPQPRRGVDPDDGDGTGSDSFDLLGFTHSWGLSRKGNWVVQRKTAKKRRSRALQRISEWCRLPRHRPVIEQWKMLSSKLRGHYAYYGITGNVRSVGLFRHATERIWRTWLDRRSNKARMIWERFAALLARYPLPPARLPRSAFM